MSTSLIKMEKAQLAKMDTATLTENIDRMVCNAKTRIHDAEKRCVEATEARKEAMREMKEAKEAGRPTDAAEAKLAAANEVRARALARLDDVNKTLEDYREEQQEMFARFGLDKNRAFREAIVATGETNRLGKEVFRIVKRNESIAPFSLVEDGVSKEDRRMMDERPEWESDDDWEGVGEDERY